MDLLLLLRAFSLVFLAELGDKTQLTTLGLAASTRAGAHPQLSIFLGSALALVCTSAIAALFGSFIAAHVNMKYVKAASAILFFAFGALLLREAIAEFKA